MKEMKDFFRQKKEKYLALIWILCKSPKFQDIGKNPYALTSNYHYRELSYICVKNTKAKVREEYKYLEKIPEENQFNQEKDLDYALDVLKDAKLITLHKTKGYSVSEYGYTEFLRCHLMRVIEKFVPSDLQEAFEVYEGTEDFFLKKIKKKK